MHNHAFDAWLCFLAEDTGLEPAGLLRLTCCLLYTSELTETDIPVNDEVRGFADILGLDPLYMGNEGKMIAVVPEKDAERALEIMRATEVGRNAAVIGRVAEGSGTVMITRLGGTRIVDVLYGEGLPRIC